MMKISEYIKYLQNLKNKHGDIEIETNRELECYDLSINETFGTPEKPYYNKKRNSVIIFKEFVFYRWFF